MVMVPEAVHDVFLFEEERQNAKYKYHCEIRKPQYQARMSRTKVAAQNCGNIVHEDNSVEQSPHPLEKRVVGFDPGTVHLGWALLVEGHYVLGGTENLAPESAPYQHFAERTYQKVAYLLWSL